MNLSTLYKVNSVILLTGESGTGKSKLAREIHTQSSRKTLPFLQVNVCAITENLFESELFGHTRGSFTGATEDKNGYLDTAKDGTIFLDEIGDLSLPLQAKLLMLLEERIYYPVGSYKPKKFLGTIIFATHKDLESEVVKGNFRADLFYRIRLFQFHLPPLRLEEKLEEIINQVWKNVCLENQNEKIMSQGAMNSLLKYQWPGNFRELKNTLEFGFYNSECVLKSENLPNWVKKPNTYEVESELNNLKTEDFHKNVEAYEKKLLLRAFNLYQGKVNLTSRRINLNKVTLISKIKKYDINTLEIKYFTNSNKAY